MPEKSCDTCKHHTGKWPAPVLCRECLEPVWWTDGTHRPHYPYWESKEAMQKSIADVVTVTPPESLYNVAGHGIKHDGGKDQWHLLPSKYLRGVVRVMMRGAKKYSPHNWRKGMPWTQPYNAMRRHMDAWESGEDLDPETGESHVDHALCCLLFLRSYIMERPDLDDRYKGDVT